MRTYRTYDFKHSIVKYLGALPALSGSGKEAYIHAHTPSDDDVLKATR